MKIKPLGNRVLVKPIEAEERTKSGLYIPDSAKEKPLQAIIVEIGDNKDIKLKPGDKVIHESYAGSEIKIDGVKHLIMDVKDIIAIVE